MDEQFYLNIINNLYDGLYFVNPEREITFWSAGAERITGFSSEEVVGHKCADNILKHIDYNGSSLCLTGCPLSRTIAGGTESEINAYLHHKDGHRVPVTVHAAPMFDEKNNVTGAIEIFKDNSKKNDYIETIEKLKKEVYTDQLTQVANRKFAEMQINTGLFNLEFSSVPCGLVLFDIDHFKKFNDSYGHNVGDKVLKMVAKTTLNLLRNSDFVCRWGGEEFVVIINGTTKRGLKNVAERIRKYIAGSWLMENDEKLTVTVSIGGTMARTGDKPDQLIERADACMYRSKENGRNQVTIGSEQN